jgi:hypothetical protein
LIFVAIPTSFLVGGDGMKINVESFLRAIDAMDTAKAKHYVKCAIGAVITGFGVSMVAKEAFGMGCNAGVRDSLQYMVDHREDEVVSIKATDNT